MYNKLQVQTCRVYGKIKNKNNFFFEWNNENFFNLSSNSDLLKNYGFDIIYLEKQEFKK